MKKKMTLSTIDAVYGPIVERLKACGNGHDENDGPARTGDHSLEDANFLICSARRKEGRTTTTLGLAVATAVAKPNQTVLLVDLDHRNPGLSAMLGTRANKTTAGILEAIHRGAAIEEIAQPTRLDNLQVIYRGQGRLSVPEDCQSDSLRSVIGQIRARYDYAYYDSPAWEEHVEARLFSEIMDRVVLVVRYNRSRKDDLLSTKRQVPEGKLAGVVLNDARNPIPAFVARRL